MAAHAQAVGDTDNDVSSVSAGASKTACAEACKNQESCLDKNLAKEHARADVKLLPEPTTIEGVKLAVSQSSASTIHGQERRSVCMIALSVDSLGEVAGRATHRRPPVEFDVLKKLVQGALLGRGGHRESDESPVRVPPGDMVSLHDGASPKCSPCSLISGSARASCWAPSSSAVRWMRM